MDAIAMLVSDHRAVEEKFVKFEGLGERAHKSRQAIVKDVIRALSVHASIEEQIFYPSIRERVEDLQDEVLEALEEHHIVKWTLSELDTMEPTAERYTAKFTVLMESVRHHVEEEEKDMFPQVRKAFSKADLLELGTRLAEAKAAAPTKPHPRSPDEPPMNTLTSLLAKPLDMVRDLGDATMREVRGAGRR